MLKIRIKTLSKESILFYADFITRALKKFQVFYRLSNLPKKKKRITLLKSPHVYKKAREQFQFTSYKLIISLYDKIDLKKLKFLLLNKPKTVKVALSIH
jgi:small subunit ribosomal protein S10